MSKRLASLLLTFMCCLCLCANPIKGLLERIDPGASDKFIVKLVPDAKTDFFELDQKGDKIVVRGSSWVNIATGINWYLKHYAGIHLSWNGMEAKLPEVLPPVPSKERHETSLPLRYDLNYCTFSYTMAFWNWERWQKEIDWMALHGINMPLAAVGMEVPWRNMLLRLGYTKEEVNQFIAGPAFLAWWAMNNLEGWGGPNPDSWYTQQEALQKKILERMRQYGMKPVLPGYAGMMPHDADKKLGLELTQGPLWNGYVRPAILQPTDPRFAELAQIYYDEQKKLYGEADFYSMDPFHEAKTPEGFDFKAAAQAIHQAMKGANPKAKWVLQAWSENPRQALLDGIEPGELIILDLFGECRPMWGIPSLWQRPNGFDDHQWITCMVENFGGNVGLHGRMDQLMDNFYETKTNPMARNLCGWGIAQEGSENNPMMFELMSELPWLPHRPDKLDWLDDYLFARYGTRDPKVQQAWHTLARSIYNCPRGNNQQGTHESIFCGRPGMNNFQVSAWSKMKNYYDPDSTRAAAEALLEVADSYRGNNNFEYDLVDVTRQALSDRGRMLYNQAIAAFKSFDRASFRRHSSEFLNLILLQDSLLATRPEFRVGTAIAKARALGNTPEEKDLYETNQRRQITTWGERQCADKGKLHDYSHREWNGLLRDFYYPRWRTFFAMLDDQFDGKPEVAIDFYALEEPWAVAHNPYSEQPEGDVVDTARRIYNRVFTK